MFLLQHDWFFTTRELDEEEKVRHARETRTSPSWAVFGLKVSLLCPCFYLGYGCVCVCVCRPQKTSATCSRCPTSTTCCPTSAGPGCQERRQVRVQRRPAQLYLRSFSPLHLMFSIVLMRRHESLNWPNTGIFLFFKNISRVRSLK